MRGCDLQMNNLISIQNQEGQLVVSSRQVAEHFEKEHRNVIRDIESIIEGMLKIEQPQETLIGVVQNWADLFIESQYQHEQNKQWYKEYLLTRDGFTLLAMGFTGRKALEWKLKYIEAFNKMEVTLKESQPSLQDLSPQLQFMINMEQEQKKMQQQLNQVNHHALDAKSQAEEAKKEIQGMRDVITLDHSQWREEVKKIVVAIAHKFGGNQYIQDVWKESYALLEQRGKTKLEIRLTNRRKNILAETGSKSKADKYTKLDVIGEEAKIRETFIAIVKEMAIKYGVA